MNKASHNTMTYLPVRQWWLRPFAFMARCQSKDIKDQCHITGFFDIRVRFRFHKGIPTPVFAHGLAEYKFDPGVFTTIQTHITSCFSDTPAPYGTRHTLTPTVMLSLECTRSRGLEAQKKAFRQLCTLLADKYRNIRFCGGAVKRDWTTVHKFPDPVPDYAQHTASTAPGNRLASLCPRLWANRHNNRIPPQMEAHDYILLDFI